VENTHGMLSSIGKSTSGRFPTTTPGSTSLFGVDDPKSYLPYGFNDELKNVPSSIRPMLYGLYYIAKTPGDGLNGNEIFSQRDGFPKISSKKTLKSAGGFSNIRDDSITSLVDAGNIISKVVKKYCDYDKKTYTILMADLRQHLHSPGKTTFKIFICI